MNDLSKKILPFAFVALTYSLLILIPHWPNPATISDPPTSASKSAFEP